MPRKRCGSGPLITLTVHEGRVIGKLVLVVPGYNVNTEMVSFTGTVDEDGRLSARAYEFRLDGTLPGRNKPGNGSWKIIDLGCKGSFQITRSF